MWNAPSARWKSRIDESRRLGGIQSFCPFGKKGYNRRMTLPPKPSFDEFIRSCTPLLKIPELEDEMRARVRGIVAQLLDFGGNGGKTDVEILTSFLRKDKDFLGVMLALTNLSQEKFLRILSAERFAAGDFKSEWGISSVHAKMKSDDEFAGQIAALFLEGRGNETLARQVADFYLDQLAVPENWREIVQDKNVIGNIVRKKLAGEYADKKGKQIEKMVANALSDGPGGGGVPHEKGQVAMVGGKEVDHAIPSIADPRVLVMVSYTETTSSNQTVRANEQSEMHAKIVRHNTRYPDDRRVFVNVVDGGGWLARRSDLKKMHAGCDYCLSVNTLGHLRGIALAHLPRKKGKRS